jgi:Holliday junction resolvase RusA-like endonuclease
MGSKIIAIEPMGAPRMTQRDVWKQRPVVVRYWAYKDELRLKLPGYVLPDKLVIEFHVAMPKSWSKKKQAAMAGQYHQVRPDNDNFQKAFMDAFGEDAHVADIHSIKRWCSEGEAPCIVLEI